MRKIIREGRPGSMFNKPKKGKIDIRKSKSIPSFDAPVSSYVGNKYKQSTSVFRKDLGGFVTSTGYVYDKKPEGFAFLGSKGSKFGVSGRTGYQLGKIKATGLPKPILHKSFSEFFLKTKLGDNGSKYNITRGDQGIITSIKAKSQKYETKVEKSRRGRDRRTSYGSYIPREVMFDKGGKIVSDVTRRTYEKQAEEEDDGGYKTLRGVYDAREKLFDAGILKKDVERRDFESSEKEYSRGDSEEKRDIYDFKTSIFDKGKLKRLTKMDTYDSFSRRGEKKDVDEQKAYVEEDTLYNPVTGQIVTKKEYDTSMTKYKGNDNKKYYSPYLRKLYDYDKGVLSQYSPEQIKIFEGSTPKQPKQPKQDTSRGKLLKTIYYSSGKRQRLYEYGSYYE